jgi:hypothetical protein
MLTVQLRLKDLTKPQLQLYLKLRIEGVGIVIQTREGHIPSQPLTLLPGQAITLHGPDLAESFYPTNLDIQGLDPAFLFQGGTLPEGLYRVYFQAFDFERGRAVSNEGVALVNVFKRQPPLLLYPANNATLKPSQPQNLLLQWLPRDMASLNAASGGSTYTLRLYEVLDEDLDPNIIAQSQLPILEKTLPATSYFLGPSDVTLVAGRKYVWQVQVSSLDGRDVFLNGGRSQVSSFRYGGNCDPPASITVLGRGNGRVLLSWPGGEDAIRYVVRYRPEGRAEWSQQVVYSTGTELRGLSDGVYVYQVGSVCSGERAGAFSSEAGIGVVGGEASGVVLGGSSSARVASVAGVAGGASSGTLNPTPVPTPEEEALNRLLNPGSVLVNTSGVKTEDMIQATLASLKELPKPACAGQVVTDPSCVSAAITYSCAPKGSLSVGDVLYVNTYQVVLTQVSGGGGTFSGEGIVTLPYLNNALFAVDFKNISVVGSVEQPGGCVTVGELVVAGSSNGALDKAVQTRLAALYQQAQTGAGQDEFVGKLQEALDAYNKAVDNLQQRLKRNGTVGKDDLKAVQKNLKAVQTFLKAFDGDLATALGKDNPALAALQQQSANLQAIADGCANCLAKQITGNTSLPEKGSGPFWFDQPLDDCDLQAIVNQASSILPKYSALMGDVASSLFFSHPQMVAQAGEITDCESTTQNPAFLPFLSSITLVNLQWPIVNKSTPKRFYGVADPAIEIAYYGVIDKADYWLFHKKGSGGLDLKDCLWIRREQVSSSYEYKAYLYDPTNSDIAGKKYCRILVGSSIATGKSGGEVLADVVEQAIFGATTAAVFGAGEKSRECLVGFSADLFFQYAILSALQAYDSQLVPDVVKALSIPNAVVACGINLMSSCGLPCQGLTGGVTGIADNLTKQYQGGKSLGELDYASALQAGAWQGVIAVAAGKTIQVFQKRLKAYYEEYGQQMVDNAISGVTKQAKKLWTQIDETVGLFLGHNDATYYDVRVTYQTTRVRAGVAFEEAGILEFHLNIPEELQKQGLGTEVFKRAILDYSPKKVKGWWKTSDIYTGGESVNLKIFKEQLALGKTAKEAVFETPSGKILKDNGFDGNPEILVNTPDEVIIHFNPK